MMSVTSLRLTITRGDKSMINAAAYTPDMYATFWALIPPVVAIVLALITKEVYSSLFIGIVIGGVFYSNFRFEETVNHV